MADRSRTVVVALAVVVAVAVNLIVYGVGRAAGGTFRFTAAGGPAQVDWLTVAGFSAVPLLIGLTLAALLAPLHRWIVPIALVVAPVLALGTILAMTVPADLDTTSTVTLALCHVTLVPISVAALRAIGRTATARSRPAVSSASPP